MELHGCAAGAKLGGADPFSREVLDVMTSLLSAAAGAVGLVAVSGAVLLTGVVLRNPFTPRWLRNDAVAQAAGLLLSAAVLAAVSHAIGFFVAANISTPVIVVLTGTVPAASAYAFWKLFGIGERLARTESGQSPFGPGQRTAALPPDMTLLPSTAH